MGVVKIIDRIPAFDTVQEALSWGRKNNISDYHVHLVEGKISYMAGKDHSGVAIQTISSGNMNMQAQQVQPVQQQVIVQPAPIVQQTPQQTTQPAPVYTGSGGSSSGGGGGGY